jgi:hypothetical protein
MTSQTPNPRGWEELSALAQRRTVRESILVDLRDHTLLMELEGGRASLVTVQPAPNGQYELQRSGRILVAGGKATEVLGRPDAVTVGDTIG